ncbi:zinc finger MYM-type protein 1-like [Ciona intestinalis]
MMGNKILRKIVATVKSESKGINYFSHQSTAADSYVYSILVDETSDISSCEQVSICIRYCNSQFQSQEDFVGFYATSKTDSFTLYNLVKDSLLRLGLSIDKLRGQGYDGGANVAGKISGLQKRLSDDYPRALYFHCAGHNLNLVVQDACQMSPVIGDAMSCLNKVVVYIRDSPKRWDSFNTLLASHEEVSGCNIRPLCATRWVLKLQSVDAFLHTYEVILDFMQTAHSEKSNSASMRSTAFSLLRKLEDFTLYFSLRLLQVLFKAVDPVHRNIQSKTITIGEVLTQVSSLANFLASNASFIASNAKNDDSVAHFTSCKEFASKLHLNFACVPRGVRVSAEDYFCGLYTGLFQTASESILIRFQAKSLQMAENLRRVLEDESIEDGIIKTVSEFYDDWNYIDILRERRQWFNICRHEGLQPSINSLRTQFKSELTYKLLLPNIRSALTLYIVIPATTCEAERSFSALRRLKTYLRSTQTQVRLNNLALMHIHRDDFIKKVDLDDAMNEFIDRTTTRRNKFGIGNK